MSQLLGRVGPGIFGDGANPALRTTRTGAAVTFSGGGRFREAVLRGRCFGAALPVAGVAPGTALGATTFFTLWNPIGSGVTLSLLRVTVGYLSGTLGAGSLNYATNTKTTEAAPTGGTNLTSYNLNLGSGRGALGIANTGGTLASTPIVGESLVSVFAELATTANGLQQVVDLLDGLYAIQPGCGLSIQGIAAAGTSPLLLASFTWEEITLGQE